MAKSKLRPPLALLDALWAEIDRRVALQKCTAGEQQKPAEAFSTGFAELLRQQVLKCIRWLMDELDIEVVDDPTRGATLRWKASSDGSTREAKRPKPEEALTAAITDVSGRYLNDYARIRSTKVSAPTLRTELSALRTAMTLLSDLGLSSFPAQQLLSPEVRQQAVRSIPLLDAMLRRHYCAKAMRNTQRARIYHYLDLVRASLAKHPEHDEERRASRAIVRAKVKDALSEAKTTEVVSTVTGQLVFRPADHLAEFIPQLRGHTDAKAILSAVRIFYAWLYGRGYCSYNPNQIVTPDYLLNAGSRQYHGRRAASRDALMAAKGDLQEVAPHAQTPKPRPTSKKRASTVSKPQKRESSRTGASANSSRKKPSTSSQSASKVAPRQKPKLRSKKKSATPSSKSGEASKTLSPLELCEEQKLPAKKSNRVKRRHCTLSDPQAFALRDKLMEQCLSAEGLGLHFTEVVLLRRACYSASMRSLLVVTPHPVEKTEKRTLKLSTEMAELFDHYLAAVEQGALAEVWTKTDGVIPPPLFMASDGGNFSVDDSLEDAGCAFSVLYQRNAALTLMMREFNLGLQEVLALRREVMHGREDSLVFVPPGEKKHRTLSEKLSTAFRNYFQAIRISPLKSIWNLQEQYRPLFPAGDGDELSC